MSTLQCKMAVMVARTVSFGLRKMGRGATTLPGRVALSLYPDILNELSVDKTVILVTGTNGKTTTTHMITSIARQLGYITITNVSGANLGTGIVTTFIEGLSVDKKARKAKRKVLYAIEIDEAAFSKISGSLRPSLCVVTNLFRDQLDRYGELIHTRKLIANGLQNTKGLVLLNSDDSLVASLEKGMENRTSFFGINILSTESNSVTKIEESDSSEPLSDASHCMYCHTKYVYKSRVFGHLGDFKCPNCGYERQSPEFFINYDPACKVVQGKTIADAGFPIKLAWKLESEKIGLPIPGLHNCYNTIAAVAAVSLIGQLKRDRDLNFKLAARASENIRPAFGRMEKFPVGNKTLCILLVKNPVGMESALSFVSQASDMGALYLLLNSNAADGKDISWIWDVDFENKHYPEHVYVSGERYGDMYLRLAYAGIDPSNLHPKGAEFCGELIDEALEKCQEGQCLYILPNYTSMLELRKILVSRYGLKDFWK